MTAKNVMKSKHFHKGILQLVQEGAIQYYRTLHTEEVLLGAVGQLQFEVFEHRMKNEYNVEVHMEHVGSKVARWIENESDVKESMAGQRAMLVKDRYDNSCFYSRTILRCAGSTINIRISGCIVFYNPLPGRTVHSSFRVSLSTIKFWRIRCCHLKSTQHCL